MPGVVSYRVKRWRHSPSGGAWLAVMASVDGHPAKLIGIELGPDDVTSDGWDETKLRAAVEATVAVAPPTLTVVRLPT
jgi:hypothetical protein